VRRRSTCGAPTSPLPPPMAEAGGLALAGALFMQEGVARLKPLAAETVQRVVDLALGARPGETTHWVQPS
jgi:hypothetical protein